jgi:hypothetical protein
MEIMQRTSRKSMPGIGSPSANREEEPVDSQWFNPDKFSRSWKPRKARQYGPQTTLRRLFLPTQIGEDPEITVIARAMWDGAEPTKDHTIQIAEVGSEIPKVDVVARDLHRSHAVAFLSVHRCSSWDD